MTSDVLVDDQQNENLEEFSIIWLDANLNENRNTEQNLRSIINHFKKFQEIDRCQQFIEQSSTKDRLILITNGEFGRTIVPNIHSIRQVISIYIYCFDIQTNKQWSSKYSKVKYVIKNIDKLISEIKQDHQIEEPLPISIFSIGGQTTSKLNGKFLFSQVLIDCLLKLKSTDEDRNELFQLLYHQYNGNNRELKHIHNFQEEYLSTDVLQWYTKECFFYKTLNSVLRTENIHWMNLYRSYISDLQQQLHKNQSKHTVNVYRAQIISKHELDHLKKSIGHFISINSFFSTTIDYQLALTFSKRSQSTESTEKILFKIEANPNVVKTKPFADISQISQYKKEKEILFMTGSIFRLLDISFDDKNQFWIIRMILASDDDNDLKEVLNYMKRQTKEKQTNLRSLAKILWQMGKLRLAEKYLEQMLKQLASDDHVHVDLYEDLAEVASQMGNYEKSTEWRRKVIRFIEQNPSVSLSKVDLDSLVRIKTNDIEFHEEIGSGGFGRVHRAKWLSNEMFVAVKILNFIQLNKDSQKIFLNELSLLNRVRHPNIVTFYGACLEKDKYSLIMEYMSLGSLYRLLHENHVQLSWSDRLSIAIQSAKAINYLHQFQPPILHRDIKSLNLLLENHQSDYLVKVCDFGLAQIRKETTCQTNGNTSQAFTLPWAAPEILDFRTFTEKSDIYSLAIVFWELASHQIPYEGHLNDIIVKSVIAGRRLKIPDSTPSNFRSIIEKCWAHKFDKRPTSVDLLKMLNDCQVNRSNSRSILQSEDRNISNECMNTPKTSFIKSLMKRVFDRTNEFDQKIVYQHRRKATLKWKQYAIIIAGDNGQGDKLRQLFWPHGIFVDDQQRSIYIADCWNHRIVKWEFDENEGQLVAGGKGLGSRIDQLARPTDVILDQKTKSLIICDWGNQRVVRWSIRNQHDKHILISDIHCYGLMMNDNGDLFVSDWKKNLVKRWRKGEKEETIVAGGYGKGDRLNQFNKPTFIFVDRNETIYVSDCDNHRVMKWMKDAREGIIVAGGHGQGVGLKQLHCPAGLIVNDVGDVYVADSHNNRIMCWPAGSDEGRIVLGAEGSNQFYHLEGLSFDGENNLYVADVWNNRIQRFDLTQN